MSYIFLNINTRAVSLQCRWLLHAIIGTRCCAWLPLARYRTMLRWALVFSRATHCSALNENQRQARAKNKGRSRRGGGEGGGETDGQGGVATAHQDRRLPQSPIPNRRYLFAYSYAITKGVDCRPTVQAPTIGAYSK